MAFVQFLRFYSPLLTVWRAGSDPDLLVPVLVPLSTSGDHSSTAHPLRHLLPTTADHESHPSRNSDELARYEMCRRLSRCPARLSGWITTLRHDCMSIPIFCFSPRCVLVDIPYEDCCTGSSRAADLVKYWRTRWIGRNQDLLPANPPPLPYS